MSAGTYNLVIDQGSDFALDLIIKQSGSALNLTNYTGRAQLRTSVDASSASATFTVTKTNASEGALKMELGAPTEDFVNELGNETLVYKTKKYGLPCDRKFEINSSGTIIGFNSSGCF